jgi:hypothetical protein
VKKGDCLDTPPLPHYTRRGDYGDVKEMQWLRTFLILLKRQITDDAPYFVGGLAAAVIYLLSLAALGFIYPRGQLLHVTFVLIVLPAVAAVTFFVFGAVQARCDHNHDIAPLLTTLAARPRQIVAARLAAGTIFVIAVVLVLGLALTGAITGHLIQWPDSLFPAGLYDLLAGLVLIGFACHFLGSMSGKDSDSAIRPLGMLPLAWMVASLIIVKGFGYPLAIILIPLIGILLAHLLVPVNYRRWTAITTGFAVICLTVIPLYWLRYSSDVMGNLVMLVDSQGASVQCHHEFPWRRSGDLLSQPFVVRAEVECDSFPMRYGQVNFLLQPLGILRYLREREPDGDPVDLDYFGHYRGTTYDARRRLFVNYGRRESLYGGPEGIAATAGGSLGAFLSPVVCRTSGDALIVYDRKKSDFYAIDFSARQVRRGPHIADSAFQPVDAITSKLAPGACSLEGHYPSAHYMDAPYRTANVGTYIPVVDESGGVAVLNPNTWTLITGAGRLPAPRTIRGRRSCRPRDLFDYDVEVIVKWPENEYAGLMAASLSRQGSPVAVAVFDESGRTIREESGEALIGPWFTTKYLIENVYPPVLTLASFFTAYSFEAGATHRALFLMPNSFVAQQRDRQTIPFHQFLWAVVFMLPGALLAGFLSWRVAADAAVMGLSRNARWMWLAGTLAFGLAMYITYRLVRPKAVLVPCRTCGRGRRVDHDLCHWCGSAWAAPELEAPAWRVVSAPQARVLAADMK